MLCFDLQGYHISGFVCHGFIHTHRKRCFFSAMWIFFRNVSLFYMWWCNVKSCDRDFVVLALRNELCTNRQQFRRVCLCSWSSRRKCFSYQSCFLWKCHFVDFVVVSRIKCHTEGYTFSFITFLSLWSLLVPGPLLVNIKTRTTRVPTAGMCALDIFAEILQPCLKLIMF